MSTHVANKWQHFVPVGYLKRWAAVENGRKSHVWRYDGETSRDVPCDSICADVYTYSKDTAQESKELGPIDATLPRLIRLALDGSITPDLLNDRTPSETACAFKRRHQLFTSLMLLHARSPDFNIDGYADRLQAMKPLWLALIPAVVGATVARGSDEADTMLAFIEEFVDWRMTLHYDPHSTLWTSENPALIATQTKSAPASTLELWCPLTPAAYVRFSRNLSPAYGPFLTPSQVAYLNTAQVAHSTGAVFSRRALTDVERVRFHGARRQRDERIPARRIARGVEVGLAQITSIDAPPRGATQLRHVKHRPRAA